MKTRKAKKSYKNGTENVQIIYQNKQRQEKKKRQGKEIKENEKERERNDKRCLEKKINCVKGDIK